MPTTKTRLNITLLPEMEIAVTKLAIRDKISKSSKAAELIRLALEIEEDHLWNKLAQKRDVKGAKFISHKKTWE